MTDFPAVLLISMIAERGGWGEKVDLNLYKEIDPLELCIGLNIAILEIYQFWTGRTDEHRRPVVRPAPVRVPNVRGRNQPCPCGSGRKFKRCCGRLID